MIRRYDSIAALRHEYIEKGTTSTSTRMGSSWYGGENFADTVRLSETGDTSLVPEAEAIISRLDAAIETTRRSASRAPAGMFCVVPDVLAGLPTPMRRMIEEKDLHSPISIISSVNSSASVTAEQLKVRGTTILALVIALARIRPVNLHMLFIGDGKEGGETIFTAQINTSPLDLATACYVLTSAGFYRRIGFAIAEHMNRFCGGWPARFNYYDQKPYLDHLAKKLSPDPERTLVIGPLHAADPLLSEPLPWINSQIARFTQAEETVP